jgi:hypothetical protein
VFGSIRFTGKFSKTMKIKTILAVFLTFALAACGPGKPADTAGKTTAAAEKPVSTGPEYDSVGVIATLDGQQVTLDHEGASAAKLVAGRTPFQGYGDVLAEAPLTPGARVAFKFRKVGAGYDLTDLKAR